MAIKSPTDVAAKWSRNLSGSTESIRQGVQSVQQSPTELAARQQDRYVQGVERAAATGKWARGLRRVSLSAWQEATLNKGLSRIASGASAAKGKMEEFLTEWLPYEEQLKAKLSSMPRGDLQANIARMVAAVEHNANFRRRGA